MKPPNVSGGNNKEAPVANGILVVDDDPLNCELIQDILESAEIKSKSTSDSQQASILIREEKFDAIFLDVKMPAPDGIALARQVRASALNRTTPIAMITGESDRHLLTKVFEAGATFVLFKPIDRHRLMRLLRVSEDVIQREARQFQRVKVTCKVSMQLGQERSVGRTLDMSLNGTMVCADKTFPVGSMIQVDLQLAPGKAPLSGTAEVVRVVGVDCMGLHFENVPLDNARKMQEFLLPLILAIASEVKTPLRSVV
jgi:two-component system, chemotaxis family, chemotaxis protein CheY